MKKIELKRDMFAKEKVIFKDRASSFSAKVFTYSTGVEAVTIKNSKGYVTLLPFMGQMIWDMEFLGHNLVMKSIYDEPEVCKDSYGESYGCFLMHCGLTAMGNPTEKDNHTPHGELPIAKYKKAYVVCDKDEKGKYISVTGLYEHKRAFTHNYAFTPEVRLYEDASTIEVIVNIKNNKDLPLEYFYLCHINYRPIDGAKLLYTAKSENIVAHAEVPEDYIEPTAQKTRDYIKMLNENSDIMKNIGNEFESYAPEIVFTCKYDADEEGNAYTMELLPDGYSAFVIHRPEELPFGIRWIARTKDEDALGMVLPATAEHMGYLYCKEHKQERYIPSGEEVTLHMKTGILSPEETNKLKEKIK